MIVLTASPEMPAISYAPPNSKMESASEGAAAAARSVMNTPEIGHAQIEAAVGIVEFAIAPFAAAYGAVKSGHQRLSPTQVSEVEHDLLNAMKANAGSEFLRDKVAEAARQRTRRLLVCAAYGSNVPASSGPASAVLEVSVEQLRLNIAKDAKNEYVLFMTTRARLLKGSAGVVLMDKMYQYQSGSAFFIDWARYRGLEGVAQTGYQSMAEQIADDIFRPAYEPPLLIGPGQKESQLGPTAPRASEVCSADLQSAVSRILNPLTAGVVTARRMQFGDTVPILNRDAARSYNSALPSCDSVAGSAPRFLQEISLMVDQDSDVSETDDSGFYLVGLGTNNVVSGTNDVTSGTNDVALGNNEFGVGSKDVTSVQIYNAKPGEHLRLYTPGTDSSPRPEAQTDTTWKMDNLQNDRNSVVQWLSCVAAVPMGLWEQTGGAVSKHSQEKTEKLIKVLNELPEQRHLGDNVADAVARHLRSQIQNPVRLAEDPARFALSTPGEANPPDPPATGAGTATSHNLALEIQVLDAALVGKHDNSQVRALCVEVQATVFRTSDGQELYSRPIRYRSSSKKLKDWAAADGKLFRNELTACEEQTAEALTSELLGRGFVTQTPVSLVPAAHTPE